MLLRRILGRRLRVLRLQRGLTLREVADRAGVSLGHLSEIERGKAEFSSEVLAAILEALGVDLDQLLRSVIQPPVQGDTPLPETTVRLAA